MRRTGGFLGAGGFLLGFLLAIILIGVVALSSIYRATCGPSDTARPQYFVVAPTREVPEDCRRAKNGFTVLSEYLGVRTGD